MHLKNFTFQSEFFFQNFSKKNFLNECSKQILDCYHFPDNLELHYGESLVLFTCKSHWLNLPHHLSEFLDTGCSQDQ